MKLGNHHNNRVLIVDDQHEIHDDFKEMLMAGYAQPSADDLAAAFVRKEEEESFLPEFELLHASTGEEALAIIQAGKESDLPIAVAYIDIRMPPGIDGIETIRRIRAIDRDVEIVIMTAYTDKALPEIVQDMELLHKLLYIRKPFAHEEIQQITVSLAGKWNIERQLTNSHQRQEAVLNATEDGMAMYDEDGHLVFANRVYERLLGLKELELKKMTPRDLTARFEDQLREPDLPDVDGMFLPGGGNLVESTGVGQVPKAELFYRCTVPVRDSGEVIGSLYVYRGRVQGDRGRTDEGRSAAPAHRTDDRPLLCRHGGHQPRNAEGVRADEAGRRRRYRGAHSRRKRHRQGAGGKVRSPQQPGQAGAVRGPQLRRHTRNAHRKRVVRT